jgi:hypothetical protein
MVEGVENLGGEGEDSDGSKEEYILFKFRTKVPTLGVNCSYIFHPPTLLLRQISFRVL